MDMVEKPDAHKVLLFEARFSCVPVCLRCFCLCNAAAALSCNLMIYDGCTIQLRMNQGAT